GETEVTKALAELQKESCEFKVMIPRNRRNSEDCLFRGYFKIDGIERDRWTEFRKTLPCVAQVKERLEAAIKTGLENDPTALISLKHSLSLRHVQEVAEHAARAAALSDFGLKVTITNVGSDDVESEKKLAESVIKGRISSIENELKRYFSVTDLVTQEIQKLEQDIVRIMATGGRDDAIEENRTRIEALRKHLPIDPIVSRLHYENLRDGHSSEKSDKPEREVEMSSAPFAL
ncbi:MAG TPA: hypothetical protein VFB82_01885, partial [Blastocatellia bacterium]|nr:hypothetical protein [Blastocatellia bacterium]